MSAIFSGYLTSDLEQKTVQGLALGDVRCRQYSSGNRKVVTLRSASVMIHRQLSPCPAQDRAGFTG